VDTWNKKDVRRMRRLHADDVSRQLYGIGEEFVTVETLLGDIERENFWGLSYAIKVVDPKVRVLGSGAALVTFKLIGQEISREGGSKRYSGAYSLIFERQKSSWKITHVHSSHGAVPGSATKVVDILQ
jgi:hypothetical protein